MTGMRFLTGLIAAIAAWVGAPGALGGTEASPQPTKVHVGVFLNSIPHVDLQANQVAMDAYIWFRWDPARWPPSEAGGEGAKERGAALLPKSDGGGSAVDVPPASAGSAAPAAAGTEPAEEKPSGAAGTFEVIGADEASVKPVYNRPEDGYCCIQWKGKRSNHWDVRSYPFDRQEIRLTIEDASFDDRQLQYVADSANCGFSPDLRVAGCKIDGIEARVDTYTYPTNFGDPRFTKDTQSNYSRFTMILRLHRDGWGMFFKLFTALLISTFVALLAFWINPTQVDPRFGLCVGGLFGIIASSYAVAYMLPETGEVCYADRMHQVGLLAVLITVIESAVSLSFHLNMGDRGARIARRLDRISALVVSGGFVMAVIWLTVRAAAMG